MTAAPPSRDALLHQLEELIRELVPDNETVTRFDVVISTVVDGRRSEWVINRTPARLNEPA